MNLNFQIKITVKSSESASMTSCAAGVLVPQKAICFQTLTWEYGYNKDIKNAIYGLGPGGVLTVLL